MLAWLKALPSWLQLLASILASAIFLAGSAKGLLQAMAAYTHLAEEVLIPS
jgi:hypothetical protein